MDMGKREASLFIIKTSRIIFKMSFWLLVLVVADTLSWVKQVMVKK